MKTLITLLFLLTNWMAWGQTAILGNSEMGTMSMVMGGGPPASCATLEQKQDVDNYNYGLQCDNVNFMYRASRFIATNNCTICALALLLRNVSGGTPTNSIRLALYSDSGSTNPSTLVGSWTGWFAMSNVSTTTTTWYTNAFTGDSASLTAGSTYWIVMNYSSLSPTYYPFVKSATFGTSRVYLRDADAAGTWTEDSNQYQWDYYLLKSP